MAAAAAMAATSMASAYTESVALGIQADQEQLVASINSDVLKIKEQEALKQGDKNLEKFKRQVGQLKGQQKVALAASGVSIDYGSALTTQEDTDLLALEDENRIKNNAMLEAWGYKTESKNVLLKGQYAADALRAKSSSTLLGGALKGAAYAYEGFGKMKAPTTTKDSYSIPSGGTSSTGRSYNTNEDQA